MPLTEVQVWLGKNTRRYTRVPAGRIKPILIWLKHYEEKPVSWRELAGPRIKAAGGEAAYMLKAARKRAGMTQMQLAKSLEMPQGNISQIESGKRPIGKALAKRLAKIFNLDYRVFL
ncbi:MAG: helix-turn-helix transcriptional regulator [Deltaproteobacteria bacterium]|nr:helix-turn-helix transcriptional regulator [Deltaproteobacteria bacterium]